ncbi:MAG TPA: energy-coupling factor ABC transporter permease [Candidatus Omnitrophota bacterium]|nr:energy-coupling factor ABC transporter permease [Candidatus Omnitrophota bacterium]HPN55707.1 energy-coupling factor ABC transporter permease [Candidatus Omnitrophota bacterium]
MILAILLGLLSAFLAIASVLVVEALFLGDGGLLALGCNIFNLGFFPCFVAYPFVYRKIVENNLTQRKIVTGSPGGGRYRTATGSVRRRPGDTFPGVTELPFVTFVLLMQPIHLAIGIVEGLVTAAGVLFVFKARPEILYAVTRVELIGAVNMRTVLAGLPAGTRIFGGALSWFASSRPDGLEWAMRRNYPGSGQAGHDRNL